MSDGKNAKCARRREKKTNLHVRESNPGRLRDRQKCYQLHQHGPANSDSIETLHSLFVDPYRVGIQHKNMSLIIRSYHGGSTASHPNCEVKHLWAQSVLRWGTTRESWVSNVFFQLNQTCVFFLAGIQHKKKSIIIRSYHGGSTASHPNCEVKHLWAQSVLRWGTTRESWVSNVFLTCFLNFFLSVECFFLTCFLAFFFLAVCFSGPNPSFAERTSPQH